MGAKSARSNSGPYVAASLGHAFAEWIDVDASGYEEGGDFVNELYWNAVRLLLKAAPAVFDSGVFALKGGTAINLFVRDMPRLSVDLDLVYRDYRHSRTEAMANIGAELRRMESGLQGIGLSCEP